MPNLAGYNNSSYLNHGKAQWSMSPETFSGSASMFGTSNYYVTGILAGNSGGVRPAISLKPSAYVSTGDGSADTPYVIE